MKYQLFSPCEMALSEEEPPTFHSQCLGELGGIHKAFSNTRTEVLRCSCDCHPWADKAKETTNAD